MNRSGSQEGPESLTPIQVPCLGFNVFHQNYLKNYKLK